MGYYSEACLCLKKGVLEKYNTRLALQKPSELNELGSLLESAEHIVDPDTGAEMWHWKSVKWYADYEDVAAMESFLAALDDEDYRFVRIGEDFDDNEVRGWHCDNTFSLSLARNITCERPQNGNS